MQLHDNARSLVVFVDLGFDFPMSLWSALSHIFQVSKPTERS
jgi:hypothetical protein